MNNEGTCDICGQPKHPQATYCKRCKKLVGRGKERTQTHKQARAKALKAGWDPNSCRFLCHYSGVQLDEENSKSPKYVTFDHRIPRQGNDLVLAAACINDMKSDLTEAEFEAVVVQLARRFSGGLFDEAVLNLEHWKR
jgi:hypothetical protein